MEQWSDGEVRAWLEQQPALAKYADNELKVRVGDDMSILKPSLLPILYFW